MRALVTLEERRDAALDVANFLCDAGLELTTKYPNGSTFTAVGLSENGDAVLHVERPDRSDAFERIPSASLQYLRPAVPTQAHATSIMAVGAKTSRVSVARQSDGSYLVIREADTPKRFKVKTNVTILRIGGTIQTSHPDAPVRDPHGRRG